MKRKDSEKEGDNSEYLKQKGGATSVRQSH